MLSVYQPIVNHVSEEILGFEALFRPWSRKGRISPQVWFESSIRESVSYDADMAAFETALEMFLYFTPIGSDVLLFVNLLPTTLTHPQFQSTFYRKLQDSRFPPHRLVVEITELVPYDPDSLTIPVLNLRSMGIRVALDDIGQGSSTLDALTRIAPEYVKVDRSFIHNISTSPAKKKTLNKLVDYVRDGRKLITEGIESEADLHAVIDSGVELSQGYLWGVPKAIGDTDELTILLELKRAAMHRISGSLISSNEDRELLEKSREIDELVLRILSLERE